MKPRGAWACIAIWILGGIAAMAAVKTGGDMLAEGGFQLLKGKRVGLITNPSGVNSRRQSTIDLLRRAPNVKLVALFAAEHGLRGTLPAGTEFPNAQDPRTSLPVYSLYGPGPTRKPTPAMLRNIDTLVYDVQDTGCRSYTFISTMGLAMEACGENGKEFMVLDRPNPLGGLRVEGPLLDPRFRSFVGQWEIPYVYGMTCGELAHMIKGERWISKPCRLTIVRMAGWKRSMAWRDTDLAWVPTSPNIPRGDSPLYYTSVGVLGSVGGVNIGIGQNRPFEFVAATWLDDQKLSRHLNGRVNLDQVRFSPFTISYRNELNKGVRLVFKDPARAPLLALNFHLMEAIRATSGRDLYQEARRAGKDFGILDKVAGTETVQRALKEKWPANQLVKSWQAGEEAFRQRRQKYLLY
ncbi:MAG TPA: DUF1343 domain-containing protein [Candidatus Paceibacterota bacterium]|nr:DUF1343 domain-containing protein [Verrucomicrobiota bacterium]HRY47358.1 DUF1343 domain-containing protein [Candidatus Paceibacterota bacterium]